MIVTFFIPNSSAQEMKFFPILPAFSIVTFYFSRSECMISHYALILYYSNDGSPIFIVYLPSIYPLMKYLPTFLALF